ncbi:MAG: hypothetical protein WBC20_11785 [Candidatus Aminicenantaceae bacterium]
MAAVEQLVSKQEESGYSADGHNWHITQRLPAQRTHKLRPRVENKP